MATSIISPKKKRISQDRLTDAERIFCAEYLANGMVVEEAVKATWPEANPYELGRRGNRMLNRPRVKAYLGRLLQSRIDNAGFTAEKLIKYLETVLFLDPIHVFEANPFDGVYQVKSLEDIPPHIRQCISSIKVSSREDENGDVSTHFELKFVSKDKALELAMKYFGLFSDTNIHLNLNSPNGRPHLDFDKLCRTGDSVGRYDDVIEGKIEGRIESDSNGKETLPSEQNDT